METLILVLSADCSYSKLLEFLTSLATDNDDEQEEICKILVDDVIGFVLTFQVCIKKNYMIKIYSF